jgi:hypothetical protein
MSYLNKQALSNLVGSSNCDKLILLDLLNSEIEKTSEVNPQIKNTFSQRMATSKIPLVADFFKPIALQQAVVQGVKPFIPEAASSTEKQIDFLRNAPKKMYDKGMEAYNNVYNVGSGLGKGLAQMLGIGPAGQELAGKYALPALSIAAVAALGANSRKKRQQQQNSPIIINMGNDRKNRLLDLDPSSVQSLSSYKYASYLQKKADIITSTLMNAAKNRVANKVLDKIVSTETKKEKNPSKDKKEVELTSSNPEVKALLENEDNKKYLEKLISEKA